MSSRRHPLLSTVAKPELLRDVPFDAYCDLLLANSHGLMAMLKSPAHYLAEFLAPDTGSTPAQELGKMIHSALLEPSDFRRRHRIYPDFGTGEGSRKRKWAWEEEQRAECPDALLLKEKDADLLVGILNQVESHPRAGQLLRDGVAECTAVWNDRKHGIGCKARFDYVVTKDQKRPVILDLKTVEDASKEAFGHAVFRYMWDLQAAHYTEGGRAVFNAEPYFVWLAVEKKPPYALALYAADEMWLDIGNRRRDTAISGLSASLENDQWPAYPPEIQNLPVPNRAFYAVEE